MKLAVRNDDGTYSAKEVDESNLKRKLTKGQMEDNKNALNCIEIFKQHLRYVESKENPLPFDELILRGKRLMQMDDGPEKEAEIAVLRELYPIGSKAREGLGSEILNLGGLSNSFWLLHREINREVSRRKSHVKTEYSKIPEIKEYEKARKEFDRQMVGNEQHLRREKIAGLIEGKDAQEIQAERWVNAFKLKGDFHDYYKPTNPKGLEEALEKKSEALRQVEREVKAEFEQGSKKVRELTELWRVLYELNKALEDKEYKGISEFDGISGFGDRYEEENSDEDEEYDEEDDELLKSQMRQLSSDVESGKLSSLSAIEERVYEILKEHGWTTDDMKYNTVYNTIPEWKDLLMKEFKTVDFNIIINRKDGKTIVDTIINRIKEMVESL